MSWTGLDVGGANIKLASTGRTAKSIEFPLWKKSTSLTNVLSEHLKPLIGNSRFAVTMTGELADCFETKRQGVEFIVNSFQKIVSSNDLFFYQTDGSFVSARGATRDWLGTAASNWHALARFSSRFLPEQTGIVIDIGSTTTDIVPVVNGQPASSAKTDLQRLQNRELVYTGIKRTPVCSLIDIVQLGGGPVSVANELFATTLDAYLFLGNIKQSESGDSTADGRPATIRCAVKRLARMVCADDAELDPADIRAIAEKTAASQQLEIENALRAVKKRYPECSKTFFISGSGDWLAKQILRKTQARVHLLEFAKLESPQLSVCGAAFAVASLASEMGLE